MKVKPVIFETEGEAVEVVTQMREIMRMYGVATVADYYELAGVTTNYTDNKYGWFEIPVFSIVKDRIGYELRLPSCMPFEHDMEHEPQIES